jgi:hypothetical protein
MSREQDAEMDARLEEMLDGTPVGCAMYRIGFIIAIVVGGIGVFLLFSLIEVW